MPTIAAHTLGCKVNQYDTQAMLELFLQEGYHSVSMDQQADVYLINTCTVTGTGDKKSLQLIRKIRREHPSSLLVVCGCMAQQRGEELLSTGADLVLGTQRRHEVTALLRQVAITGKPLCAVAPLQNDQLFECLSVSALSEHTRAVLKIQEGCGNHCSYCIIPSVRGPVRSRPLNDIRNEVLRLAGAGFCEVVLTGIHLCSYGRDLDSSLSLLDVIRTVQDTEGILRIRLGSLEPTVATPSFAAELRKADKICPQFHLALQSGSDTVLARMRRRYNTSQYLTGVENLRREFPHAAFTTDILTGFPGETREEFEETKQMIETVGFARIHVFPYSPRPGTPAASMPGQLPSGIKEQRARELIALGHAVAGRYLETWTGAETTLIPEEKVGTCWEGYTPEYIRVRLRENDRCLPGKPVRIRLLKADPRVMSAEIIDNTDRKDD
ncbi:MAG: tRNA (N(6)-L-threonylcarbamoyladenosine(37)-C(2))-methylthiotransferase MtaB [Clostridiales bacterium]|nr:tRNA (N(6)-L-threonylcarbamoyladenosine(37)-C(2))-methylthiotransferase MtaB [Clostridiales bacterium]